MTTSLAPIVEWAVLHINTALQSLGWIAVITLSWKISGLFSNLKTRATTVETHVINLATKHFPELQRSLDNHDTKLGSIDGSLKTLVNTQAFVTAKPVQRRKATKKK